MKLIIDVDEKLVCEGFERPFTEEERNILIRAIGNGRTYNPSGDAISREALRETISGMDFDFGDYYDHTDEIIDRVCEKIDNAESVETYTDTDLIEENKKGFNMARRLYARPKGEWINHRNDCGHNIADCSLCGKTMQWHDEDGDGVPRYCWYCGADMRTEDK